MFFFLQLQYSLLRKKSLLLFLLLPLLVASPALLAEKSASDKTKIYRCIIIDKDKSGLSRQFIEELKAYEELQIDIGETEEKAILSLNRRSCDLVCTIKEGFEDRLQKGERSRLLTIRSEAGDPSVKWFNDQLSLHVMRLWSYQDIFRRIRSLDPSFDEKSYADSYARYPKERELLKLRVLSEEGEQIPIRQKNIGSSVFTALWLYLILLLALTSQRRLTAERIQGIPDRLGFSGVGYGTYLLTHLALFSLKILIPLPISLLLLREVSLPARETLPLMPALSLAFAFLLACWGIFFLISRFSKTVLSYMLTSQILCGLLILLSGFWLIGR